MTDIKAEETLKEGVDLLAAALRDLDRDAETALKAANLGRAHARALTVIARRQGLTVADLLRALRITKQSLNRVLADLLAGSYVEQRADREDRRKRLLFLTAKGEALEAALWHAQRGRVARAFREAGPDAAAGFHKVLAALTDERKSPGGWR